jgi:hypothetical protein
MGCGGVEAGESSGVWFFHGTQAIESIRGPFEQLSFETLLGLEVVRGSSCSNPGAAGRRLRLDREARVDLRRPC